MTDDPIWDGFAGAVVRIELPTGASVLAPREEGVDAFPFDAPVHIITAYNPDGAETDEATNERRHQDLGERVAANTAFPTIGSAPDGSMPEPGYALLEMSLATALEIGAEFGQRAIYRWTADRLSVVGVHEPVQRHLGWSLSKL